MRPFLCVLSISLMVCALTAGPQATADQSQIKRATSLFDKGVKAAQQNKLAEAEQLFSGALAEYPLLPGAYVELGKIRMSQNRPDLAVEYYLKAKDAYIRLHDEKLKNENRQQSRERGTAQEANDARNSSTMSSGGFAKQAAQQTKDEKRELDRNVIAAGQEAEIPALFYLYLGGAYMRLGKSDLAEPELMEGIRRDERLAPLHFNLAVIYLGRAKYQESAAEARLAKKYGFQIPPAFIKDLETRGNLTF